MPAQRWLLALLMLAGLACGCLSFQKDWHKGRPGGMHDDPGVRHERDLGNGGRL